MFSDKISTPICLCGDGWGAQAALEGLSLNYSDVVVVSTDEAINENALARGFRTAKDLLEVDTEFFVCAGLTQILEKKFLETNRVLNIHYSILPKYRGLHSIVWSILNDELYFGLTVHEMTELIDDGAILYQYKFENVGQTSLEVMEECNKHVADNLSTILNKIKSDILKPVPQNRKEATWVCKRNLSDCLIDYDQSVDFLNLFFRALVEPYPLPRIQTKTGILEVVKSELVKSNYYMHNGRVVNRENGKVWIKIADGFLIISEIRDCKTKEPLAIRDTFKLGERLN